MTSLHLPVRPNLEQLRHQAKDLLAELRVSDELAILDFKELFTGKDPSLAKLSQAQYVLARRYGVASWNRLVLACQMTDAIWRNDVSAVRELIIKHPSLITEDARGVKGNWGPPMSYAATVGASEVVELCSQLGAADIQFAFERACLRGNLSTAKLLIAKGAILNDGIVMGPCETLNGTGLEFLFQNGAKMVDHEGNRLAPVGLVLQTYSRNPQGKHLCLELMRRQGLEIPKTPSMAIHCGRTDWLDELYAQDPAFVNGTYRLDEIYPRSMGCSEDPSYGLHGTPLNGAGLLHMAIDYDEVEIGRWLLDHGADVNLRAEVDSDGFGGQTPLFHAVVNQSVSTQQRKDAYWAKLLIDAGAEVSTRATLRKAIRFYDDESEHQYRDVSAVEWGERFHGVEWRNLSALALIKSINN